MAVDKWEIVKNTFLYGAYMDPGDASELCLSDFNNNQLHEEKDGRLERAMEEFT